MKLADRWEQFVAPPEGIVLTIGNFDGVHLGHARIVRHAREVAQRFRAPVVAITFEPHPLAILAPERAPARLTTPTEKLALLKRSGVDHVIVLRSEPELLATEAEDFLATLVARGRPRAIVEGPDFNFGRARRGSIETLQRHAQEWGYEVHRVPAVHCEALPTRPTVSSSSIRQALRDGRVAEAAAMLGRPYRITGTIGYGAGRGARLGIPTANLEGIAHMLPQEAVYACAAQLEDGHLYPAAVNVGPQPTFEGERCQVEVHILDFGGDLRGRRLGLHFLARLRSQIRFSTSEELVQQIRRDVEAVHSHAAEIAALERSAPLPL